MLSTAWFSGARNTAPDNKLMSWEELAAKLTQHEVRPEKDGRCWSPTRYNAGATRKGANVVALSCAVFDIDHVSEPEAEETVLRLRAANVACAMHSTFSHNPPADCALRLVFPLQREITPEEWKRLRLALLSHFGLKADEAAKDPSRLFYMPAHPPGAPAPFVTVEEGPFVDPDTFLKRPPKQDNGSAGIGASDGSPAVVPLNIGSLRALARRRLNAARKDAMEPATQKGVQNALDEVELAPHGSRKSTLHAVMSWLAFTLPEVSDEHLLELVRASVEAFPDNSTTDMRRASESLAQARQAYESKKEAEAELERLARVEQRAGPRGAYTAEEVAAWGIPLEQLSGLWMLSSPLGIFFLVDGQYIGPVKQDRELVTAIPQYLARAESGQPWGIQFTVPTANGEGMKLATRDELLRRHSFHVRNVEYSFVRQKPELDAATSTLWMPVRPLRAWQPREHKDVQRWLELIAGERYREKFLDWVATVTRLDRMSCAVYIEAPKNLGKNLLANGLAKLWTEGMPAKFEDLVSDFQDSLMHCPIVHADEALPSTKQSTVILRQLVSNPYTYVNQKFGAKSRVHGAIRLLMTANNSSMLRTAESLTEDDLNATASRILHIKAGPEAGAYRCSLGAEPDVAYRWCEGGAIAEHALWLAQTRKVKDTGRFLVEGETSEASHSLALNSEHVEAVCEILAKHLLEPQSGARAACDAGIIVGSGEVLVSAGPFSAPEVWEAYAPTHDQLSPTAVGRAFALITGEAMKVRYKARQFRARRVRVMYLRAWIEQSGIGTVEAFDELLAKPSEDVERIKAANPQAFLTR